MNQVVFRAVFAVSVLFLLLSHSHAQAQNLKGKVQVLTSIKPLALIARDIGGEYVQLESLINNGASPHHFSLKFSQLRAIKEAPLLLWVGPKMEGFLAKALSDLAPSQVLITASELQGITWPKTHSHADHAHAVDMHLWLASNNALVIAQSLKEQLSNLLPAQIDYFEARYRKFAVALERQQQQTSMSFDAIAHKNFGVYHDGYAHFIADFGLIQQGHFTLVPEEQISIKRLMTLKEDLKNASCLIAEHGEASKARKYANKLSLPLVEVDLLASKLADEAGFVSYMALIAASFEECFIGAAHK